MNKEVLIPTKDSIQDKAIPLPTDPTTKEE